MASKNNPAQRAGRSNEKEYDGKKIKPVLYVGSFVGHSKYVAAQDEGGKMIVDADGKPIPFSQL